MAVAVNYATASRLWLATWTVLGAILVWPASGGQVEARRAQLTKVPEVVRELPGAARVSWWPAGDVTPVELTPAAPTKVMPKPQKKPPRLPPMPALPDVTAIPSWDELTTWANGELEDPKVAQLRHLQDHPDWADDPSLTVVAIYVRCPPGPGMCIVEDARVLQTNQADMRRLLGMFGQGAKINLAVEDRVKMADTGAAWVMRSFKLATSAELVP